MLRAPAAGRHAKLRLDRHQCRKILRLSAVMRCRRLRLSRVGRLALLRLAARECRRIMVSSSAPVQCGNFGLAGG